VQKWLTQNRAEPETKAPSDTGISVRTIEVHSTHQRVSVGAQGTVMAAREVSLQPEVQGRVIYRSESLVPGGRFKKGDLLLRIDPREYSIRAKQSASEVHQAEQQLLLEASRGKVAEQEWNIISDDEVPNDVALRKPQMQEAEARRDLAAQARDLALLNVDRTALRAPFNGIVQNAHVNVGQYVSPAVSLGTLVGSDEYWVRVSVPVQQLGDIFVPGFNAKPDEGSDAVVWQSLESSRIERKGQVVRLFGDVDPMGRLARVLVQIEDPLGLMIATEKRGLPLLLGSYVHVDIEGHQMADVIEIPRLAVHAGRYVYVYGKDDRLEVREVEIAWRRPTTILLRSGVADGDEIIVSRLGTAIDGLKLRRAEEQ
jgi:RND family efflux transporter MFP subunit